MTIDPAERETQRELLREYHQTRDLALRDQLVAANLRLALHLARRFSNRGVSLDDLEQVASLGLLQRHRPLRARAAASSSPPSPPPRSSAS